MNHTTRRNFLRRAASVSTLAGTPFAANLMMVGAAAAQQAADHRSLVCVYLAGGNDQSNTVVPSSGAAYDTYAAARPTLTLPAADLVPIAPAAWSGPSLGLHPGLAPLAPLFAQGRLAIVANVGTLVVPVTQSQWNNGRPRAPVPLQLFSHSDQTGAWQTGVPNTRISTGWLGRVGDLTESAFNTPGALSIAMSVAGNTVMLSGDTTTQYRLTTNGAVRVEALTGLYNSTAGAEALRRLMTAQQRPHAFEAELGRIGTRSIGAERTVSTALAGVNVTTAFPATRLGAQLAMVARMIAARGTLGQRRQIFFVQAGGFDTHDNLLVNHAARMQELGAALAAFHDATVEIGAAASVTTFTASDFGRALQSNGRGSDHGWGGHHFVMGGAVAGGRVYGQFPTVALRGPEDAGQGRLIPSTAVDQYAATIARWFGVAAADLPRVLPNLGSFAQGTLGFMG